MTQRHVLCTGDAKGIYLFLCVSVLFCFCCLYQCGESVKQCAKDEEEGKGGRGERKRRRKKCEADTPHKDTQTTTPNTDRRVRLLLATFLTQALISETGELLLCTRRLQERMQQQLFGRRTSVRRDLQTLRQEMVELRRPAVFLVVQRRGLVRRDQQQGTQRWLIQQGRFPFRHFNRRDTQTPNVHL